MRLRRKLREIVKIIFGKQRVSFFLKSISHFSRQFASFCHKTQLNFDWTVEPQPEWFDHNCDQFYNFRIARNPIWVERGTFGLLAIKEGADVLELCCGDGFNSYHFYSNRVSRIISVDFDKEAIRHAKKYNQGQNITFKLIDIRNEMPEGRFDNIIWDAAIEHFTEEEIDSILKNIKLRLRPGGILTGYTLVESTLGKGLSHHEREFKSKDDLISFFEPHFENIKVFETIYPSRHNLYFYASDGTLPFDDQWGNMVTKRKEL